MGGWKAETILKKTRGVLSPMYIKLEFAKRIAAVVPIIEKVTIFDTKPEYGDKIELQNGRNWEDIEHQTIRYTLYYYKVPSLDCQMYVEMECTRPVFSMSFFIRSLQHEFVSAWYQSLEDKFVTGYHPCLKEKSFPLHYEIPIENIKG